jgi:hypothetical protein
MKGPVASAHVAAQARDLKVGRETVGNVAGDDRRNMARREEHCCGEVIWRGGNGARFQRTCYPTCDLYESDIFDHDIDFVVVSITKVKKINALIAPCRAVSG